MVVAVALAARAPAFKAARAVCCGELSSRAPVATRAAIAGRPRRTFCTRRTGRVGRMERHRLVLAVGATLRLYCGDLQRIAFCPSCAMPTMGIAHRAARVASFLNCRGAGVDGNGVLRAVDGRVNFRATTIVELGALSLAVTTAITGPPEIRDLPRWVAGCLACGHVLALDLARGAVDALEPVHEVVLVSPGHRARLPQVGSAALRHCAFPTSRTRFAPAVSTCPLPRRTHRALAIHNSHTNFAGRAALAVWHRDHLLVVAVIGRSGRVKLAVVALRLPFIVRVLA
jgi:hypothetical protein